LAVVIEIGDGGSAVRFGRGRAEAGLGRDVLERAASRVEKKRVVQLVPPGFELLDQIVDVGAGDEQVFPAVVVEIRERGAPSAQREAGAGELRRGGDVTKDSLAGVVEKREGLAGQGDDVNIVQTVIIVLAESG